MTTNTKFDPRSIFRVPVLAGPSKFSSLLCFGGFWGVLLHRGDWDAGRLASAVVLLVLGAVLGLAFFGWDRGKLDGARWSLYGLYTAGQALMQGTLAFVFLMAYSARQETLAMCLSGFMGLLLVSVAAGLILRSNMLARAGNNSGNNGEQ